MLKYKLNFKIIETQMERLILSKHTLRATLSGNFPLLSFSLIEHAVQYV